MPYRLTYYWSMDWYGSGLGPFGGNAQSSGPCDSNNQTLTGVNLPGGQNVVGTGTAGPAGNQLSGADVTTLTNAMAVDVAAQMNAQLGRLQGFNSGLG